MPGGLELCALEGDRRPRQARFCIYKVGVIIPARWDPRAGDLCSERECVGLGVRRWC